MFSNFSPKMLPFFR